MAFPNAEPDCAHVRCTHSREVDFTPESAETATWRTLDTETGNWVDASMVDVQTLSPAVFKLDGR